MKIHVLDSLFNIYMTSIQQIFNIATSLKRDSNTGVFLCKHLQTAVSIRCYFNTINLKQSIFCTTNSFNLKKIYFSSILMYVYAVFYYQIQWLYQDFKSENLCFLNRSIHAARILDLSLEIMQCPPKRGTKHL